MLVDINLLPQKEKRKSFLFVIIFLVFIILSALGIYIWSIYNQQVQTKENLEKQLAYIQKLRGIQETKTAQDKGSGAVHELETAIKWAEETPVSTFLLVRSITSLLPERGFMLTFSFIDSGKVQISVQFDSSRQAAYFLKRLSDSAYIKEARLQSIQTEKIEEEGGPEAIEQNNETVLPRYIAQYNLQINKQALQKAKREGKVLK
jgi:type IV pilus assembly protein PilN